MHRIHYASLSVLIKGRKGLGGTYMIILCTVTLGICTYYTVLIIISTHKGPNHKEQ